MGSGPSSGRVKSANKYKSRKGSNAQTISSAAEEEGVTDLERVTKPTTPEEKPLQSRKRSKEESGRYVKLKGPIDDEYDDERNESNNAADSDHISNAVERSDNSEGTETTRLIPRIEITPAPDSGRRGSKDSV